MSRVQFVDAKETDAWMEAEVVVYVPVPPPEGWFSAPGKVLESLLEAHWFARNVANCGYSMHDLMNKNTEVYQTNGVPGCARRLKGLLIYFLWVIEDFWIVRYPKLDKTITDQTDVKTKKERADEWTQSLRGSLEAMDSYLNPPTPKAVSAGEPANVTFSPTTMKNWAVSSEAMHEMLGSFYIWTTIRTSDGADLLKDRDRVGDLLQRMMKTYAPAIKDNMKDGIDNVNAEQTRNYTRPKNEQKWGLPECIFTAQHDGKSDTLVIGSTAAHYPAIRIRPIAPSSATTASSSAVSSSDEKKSEDTIDQGFGKLMQDARFRRMEIGSPSIARELVERLRPDDYDYMDPVITFLKKAIDSNKAFISRAIVNFYIQQRQRTTPKWKNFNHRDKVAKSFYVVVPGNPSSPRFFAGVPRCMKCRTIMSYIIPVLEAPDKMDAYLNMNPPKACAEDIVHAKLRRLDPDGFLRDKIEPPPPTSEMTMQDMDKDIQKSAANNVMDPRIDAVNARQAAINAETPRKGMQTAADNLQKAEDLMDKSKGTVFPAPLPANASDGEKKRYEAFLKKAQIENAKQTTTRGKGEVAWQASRKENLEQFIAMGGFARIVYEYFATLKGIDLTGETPATNNNNNNNNNGSSSSNTNSISNH